MMGAGIFPAPTVFSGSPLAMSRSERLLDLLQILRRHRQPVGGRTLAAQLGISLRTLYRDIATLQGQGAAITGEAGLGYVLRPGFTLPPLMFSLDEVEALVLGSRWVAGRADDRLALAARDALAKIAAVLPTDMRADVDNTPLLVGSGGHQPPAAADMSVIRDAIRGERKLALHYQDGKADVSRRVVWPFVLGFFNDVRIIAAWCELRQDFRHFRIDRIRSLAVMDVRYPRRRATLLREWRQSQGIPTPP